MKQAPEKVAGLHVVTTNTTLDNIVLHNYMLQLHEDLASYALEHDLPIFTKELKPNLSVSPMVEYVGRGKLLRTPQTSVNGRDCARDWKILPASNEIKRLENHYQTEKILSVSGSRASESTARKASLEKRNESANEVVKTDMGWAQPIIMDWSLDDVWSLFRLVDDGDIESYSDNFNLMSKHYSAGNGGTCDLFAGNSNKSNKSCGARFGCMTCAMGGETDESLEAQVAIDSKTYGFMKPMTELRTYMVNTLWDFNHRNFLTKDMSDNFIKVGVNQYSLEYRMNLLRYILTIQENIWGEYGHYLIDLIDYDTLLAIQYHWSREGGEQEPGMALKIWHEVVNEGHRYSIPKTEKHKQEKAPTPRYFPLGEYTDSIDACGLGGEEFERGGEYSNLARCFYREGEKNNVVRYEESSTFNVVAAEGVAMDFVEEHYPYLVSQGGLEKQDPSVMLKHLLGSGIVHISKGSISRLHKDAKRAQTINAIQFNESASINHFVLKNAVDEERKIELMTYFKKEEKVEAQSAFSF